MKKKIVVALLAAMTLTLGTVGTVYATVENPATSVESTKNTEERPGYIWVVDQEEQGHWEDVMVPEEGHYEEIVIEPEEGHWDNVLVSEEEGHWEDVEVSPEKGHWETIHHEAVYETVHHEAEGYYEIQQVQVGTEPIYETENHAICNICGTDICNTAASNAQELINNHVYYHADLGESCSWRTEDVKIQVGEKPIYEEKEVWVETKPAWDEEILVSEAYDESIWIIDEEAVWDKQWIIDKPAVYEDQWVIDKEAVTEQQWVVDKPATVEKQWVVDVLEKGHWEPVSTENPDTEEPENPDTDNPDTEEPINPEEPDIEEPTDPVDPENPDTEEPATPDIPENSDSDNDATDQEIIPTPEIPATDNFQATDKNISQNTGNTTSENQSSSQKTTTAPQTGDPTNLGYLVSLAGSALTGGSALIWKFRKRK